MNLDDLEENEKFRALCDRAVLAKHNAAYKWGLASVTVTNQDAKATILVSIPASVREPYTVEWVVRSHAPHGYQAVTYTGVRRTYFIPIPTQEPLTVSFRLPFTE